MTDPPPADPADHAQDFAGRHREALDYHAAQIMLDLGIPAEKIGASYTLLVSYREGGRGRIPKSIIGPTPSVRLGDEASGYRGYGRNSLVVIDGGGEMKSYRSTLSIGRGLYGAVLGAAGGAVATPTLMFGFTACRWLISEASDFDRRYDLSWLKTLMLGPVVGCTTVCACAGWATFAPFGTYRFARSLVIVFLISVPLWFIVGMMNQEMEPTPRRYKGIKHPGFYPSELMILVGPPIVSAGLITRARNRLASLSDPADDFPLE